MTYHVRVRHAAEADILEAEDWYNEQRSGLGGEFRSEVVGLLYRLVDTPLIYVRAYRDVRRAPVRRFPYLVWYRVSGYSVQVLACSHHRQDQRAILPRFQ